MKKVTRGLEQHIPGILESEAMSYTVGFRQSKTALSTGHVFDWILLVLLLIVSRVAFIVVGLLPEAVGVRQYN